MPARPEPPYSDELEQELYYQVHALLGDRDVLSRANIRKARRLMRKWPSWMASTIGVWNTSIATRRHRGQITD